MARTYLHTYLSTWYPPTDLPKKVVLGRPDLRQIQVLTEGAVAAAPLPALVTSVL